MGGGDDRFNAVSILGLLGLDGTMLLGLSLWAQLLVQGVMLLWPKLLHSHLFGARADDGPMAPMIGSWQLLIWRRRTPA